jgi:D-sedoheptulose 7-phosphate isomerase|tara:strand:- start:2842 stop:3453 length:612 start_codon:yes stop_codon:yes gene_type:complete
MNNLEQRFTQVTTIGQYSRKYFSYLANVLESIKENEINKLGEVFESARLNGNTIFVAGNGGSATTATTMANDIGFDILKKTGTNKPFRVFSLVDNNSVVTAIANDVGYENIFINQLKIHYRDGDSLIVISASGNSPNVLEAASWVKSKGGTIIGFMGFNGGKLIELCDVKIHVKSEPGEYGPVEDAHLIMNHILAHWFQNKLK